MIPEADLCYAADDDYKGNKNRSQIDRAHIFQDGLFTNGERGLFIGLLRPRSILVVCAVGKWGSCETGFLGVRVSRGGACVCDGGSGFVLGIT